MGDGEISDGGSRVVPKTESGDTRMTRVHQADESATGEPPWGGSSVMDSIWRHRALVVVGAVLGAALGFLVTSMQPPTYLAQSDVFLSSHSEFDPTGSSDYVSDPSRYVDQQARMMSSTPVLSSAIEHGAPAADVVDLRSSLDVVASKDTDLLTVRATGSDAPEARKRVDAVIAAYRARVVGDVEETVRAIESTTPERGLERVRRQAALFGDGVSLVEPAVAVRSSAWARNAALLGITGFLLALGVGVLRDARARYGASSRSNREQAGSRRWGPGGPARERPHVVADLGPRGSAADPTSGEAL